MNNVFIYFLWLSFSGSLLILALFLFSPLIKRKLSRQWQYYVWLIVIARLLLPIAPVGNLMDTAFNAIKGVSASYGAQTQTAPPNLIYADGEYIGAEDNGVNSAENIAPYENLQPEVLKPHPVQEVFALFKENYWLIWLGIAVVLLIRKITIYTSFVRYVKVGAQPVSNIELLDRVAVIGEQINVSKAVELCVNPLVSSPLLFGFFHPCIVIPSSEISDRDFENTILHELTHYKRKDMFYKWLVQITICLHWFNPLVHLMGQEINRACEFSCDEAVVKRIGTDNAPGYGNTLLESMAAVGHYKEALASVTLSESKKFLEERLYMIMSFKKKSVLTSCAAIVLTVLLLCGFTFTGAYADRANDTTTKPYLENYSVRHENSIAARSRENEWAVADTATGSTVEEILNSKLKFLEDTWSEKQKPFIVVEGISEEGITDTESLRYLYDHSSIYRDLIKVSDKLYIKPESSFGLLSDAGSDKMYERYAFYLDAPAELSLSAFYQLDIGKMSVAVVSPSGQIVYQNDMTDKFDKTVTVKLERGISSVILSYDTVGQECKGEVNIMGSITG